MAKICLRCKSDLSSSEAIYGLHETCFIDWFELPTPTEFEEFQRRSAASKEPTRGKTIENWNSSFFHGNFRKYSAMLNGESYIIKVMEEKAPELPYVEYLSNQIAENLHLEVPKYYLLEINGSIAFVSQNFVKPKSSTMSLQHIYHYLDSKKKYDCDNLLKAINTETKSYSDIEKFINLCLFDSLIGNHDRHGRNIGLLVTPKGTRLSPIYDNPSALGLESGEWLKSSFSPKGKIEANNNKEPTIKDYVIEFASLGYDDTVINFFNLTKIDKIEQIIENSLCSPLMKTAMKKLTRSRYDEFKMALKL